MKGSRRASSHPLLKRAFTPNPGFDSSWRDETPAGPAGMACGASCASGPCCMIRSNARSRRRSLTTFVDHWGIPHEFPLFLRDQPAIASGVRRSKQSPIAAMGLAVLTLRLRVLSLSVALMPYLEKLCPNSQCGPCFRAIPEVKPPLRRASPPAKRVQGQSDRPCNDGMNCASHAEFECIDLSPTSAGRDHSHGLARNTEAAIVENQNRGSGNRTRERRTMRRWAAGASAGDGSPS